MGQLSKILCQLFCGTFVGHKFELTDENYWGFDGDIRLHQYTCKYCGRHDYLHPVKDKNKDWNGGKGDGNLCPILHQY